MDMTMDPNKKIKMPRARVCYICGRQYGLTSFDIHVKQCQKLWIDRENQKPKNERKPLPVDPLANGGIGDEPVAGFSGTSTANISAEALAQLNAAATDQYNNAALSRCEFCGRTFLPEKLVIHNRACTADHPARRIGDSRLSDRTASKKSPQNEEEPEPSFNKTTSQIRKLSTNDKTMLPRRDMSKTTPVGNIKSTGEGQPGMPTEANVTKASKLLQEGMGPMQNALADMNKSLAAALTSPQPSRRSRSANSRAGRPPSEKSPVDESSSDFDTADPMSGNFGGSGTRNLRKNNSIPDMNEIMKCLQTFDSRISNLENCMDDVMNEIRDIKSILQNEK